MQLLGQGIFSKVAEAVDTQTNKRAAIKIFRAIPKYRKASKIEIRVLQKLKESDPLNRKLVSLATVTLTLAVDSRLFQQMHTSIAVV